MTQDTADSLHAPATPLRRPSRLSQAWHALRGRPVTPDAIRAEWTAWQYELEALCDKLGAAANRLFTRDKRDLDRALKRVTELELAQEDCECHDADPTMAIAPGADRWAQKAALARRFAELKGIALPTIDPQTNGDAIHVDGDQAE